MTDEHAFTQHLEPGEKLLWWGGTANAAPSFMKSPLFKQVSKSLLYSAAGVVIAVYYVTLDGIAESPALWIAAAVLVALEAVMFFMLRRHYLKQQLEAGAVTDRRLILLTPGYGEAMHVLPSGADQVEDAFKRTLPWRRGASRVDLTSVEAHLRSATWFDDAWAGEANAKAQGGSAPSQAVARTER